MLTEREGFDDIDDSIEDDDIPNIDNIEEITPEEEVSEVDVIESLLSNLRKLIKGAKIGEFYVFTDDDGCINIQFVLDKSMRMSSLMKVMNLLKKLETDILIEYESEFDLWETKDGSPLLTAKFYYDEDADTDPDVKADIDSDSGIPF